MRAKRSTLIGGTAFLCVVLCALSWFLLVSPKREATRETEEGTVALAASNDELERKVEVLREQFARLSEFKTRLAELQVKIPTDANLSALILEVDGATTASGVVLTEFSPLDGVSVMSNESGATEPAADGGADPDAIGDAAPAEGALVAFPVSLTTYGSYDESIAFVSALQTSLSRYMLVSTTQIESLVPVDATADGKPAVEAGDVKMIVQGYVYVFRTGDEVPEAPSEPAPLPARPDGKNVFAVPEVAGEA